MSSSPSSDNLQAMTALGAEWWNDSCDPEHLAEAVAAGATGATSNPVIVEGGVPPNQERWLPVIKDLWAQHPDASPEAVTWELIHEMGRLAAEVLRPVYEASGGAQGYLSLQVNPENSADPEAMYDQAVELASLAPNIAIKLPSTQPGFMAVERLIARGISVNTTVSFSVAQAIAAAEAIERGLEKYAASGNDPASLHPYVTIMLGRVGDYLGRIIEKAPERAIDERLLVMSGVWVFRRAAAIFQQREFRSTLLAAAYRHEWQWSQIIGTHVLQSIPYNWWTQFRHADCAVVETIAVPDTEGQIDRLRTAFPEYDLTLDPEALAVDEFETFEATQATVAQFREGYRKLVSLVANARL